MDLMEEEPEAFDWIKEVEAGRARYVDYVFGENKWNTFRNKGR